VFRARWREYTKIDHAEGSANEARVVRNYQKGPPSEISEEEEDSREIYE